MENVVFILTSFLVAWLAGRILNSIFERLFTEPPISEVPQASPLYRKFEWLEDRHQAFK